MGWIVSTLTSLALFATAVPALAQELEPQIFEDDDYPPFDRDCMDDYGRDLCDQKAWSEIVGTFGLAPAETVHGEGWRGVRVFTIDGYSNDMPMVSVLSSNTGARDGEETFTLEVRGLFARDGKPEVAILTREAWSDMIWIAEDLQTHIAKSSERQSDDAPPKEAVNASQDGEDVVVMMCSHAWVTVTESLTTAGVTRRIRNACGDDALFNASFAVSGNALRGFPYCNHIDPATQRNAPTQLERCLSLGGDDKIAAADVTSLLDGEIHRASDLAGHLAPAVSLTLPDGRKVSGAANVAEALRTAPFANERFDAGFVDGSAGGVSVVSEFNRYVDDQFEFAPITQTWRRIGNQWLLIHMTIAPFAVFE